MPKRFRELTLLHSNDLHGDFMSENLDEKLLGGISMLSGYVSAVRAENPRALYCIAGDMLQGSLIDSEYKGVSTIEIMNMLDPDVVSLGNHETDYGIAHLLFLERVAKFPIVCANIFIKNPYTRLFKSHKILKINGMKVMFIGVVTKEVTRHLRMDTLLGGLVNVEEAACEVGRICSAYRSADADLTVLLTHIGFEEDKRLAAMLDPDWGVDIIIGGHSHTILEQPEKVNNVLIAQAGVGTLQIGRFDIVVDTVSNSVRSYEWRLVPIESGHCPRDLQLEQIIAGFKDKIDAKFSRVLCKFPRQLTHPDRYQETELGNLMADALSESLGIDLMMLGSGSIRKANAGPIFTLGDLKELIPFDERVLVVKVTGAQLRRMLAYVLREEALSAKRGEFYQYSRDLRVTYNQAERSFERFEYAARSLAGDELLRVGLNDYHYINFESCFGLPPAELASGSGTVAAASTLEVLEEYFSAADHPSAEVDGRLTIME